MTGAPANEASALIDGHGVDQPSLERYLRDTIDFSGPLEMQEFGGGYSNVTYLLKMGNRELVMRRGPVGVVVKGAHDVSREYRALVGLAPMWKKSPRAVALCVDPQVIGAPFYLMERASGVVLRKDTAGLSPAVMRRLSENLLDTLVEYHAIDYEKAGLSALGRPAGFLQRQVPGWTDRYLAAKTDDLADVDLMAQWIAANIPVSLAPTVLHNDWKYDNVLMDEELHGVSCVLDWEMFTQGDPLVDLGTMLALWQEAGDPPDLHAARFGPTQLPGNLTRVELAARYAEKTGRALTNLPWYYVFGLFRMLVSLQQLYQRHAHGKTTEPRYASLSTAVRGMAAQGVSVINKGRIDRLGE